MDSSAIWFGTLYGVIALYAMLDGFDLGAGMIHLFCSKEERRAIISSLAPFWDGNEMWLIVAGQLLLGVFPSAYGAILSAFYLPILVLTTALVLRACAMEFRSKLENGAWTTFWDICLSLASFSAAGSYGFILGNLTVGLPLTARRNLDLDAMRWTTRFPLLVAVVVIAAFAMQGSLYLALKMRGPFRRTLRRWAIFSISVLAITACALCTSAKRWAPHLHQPPISIVWAPALVACMASLVLLVICLYREWYFTAFVCSSGVIVGGVVQFALANFPYLVRAINDPNLSLTAFNCIASPQARLYLQRSLLVGVPMILSYTIWIYYIFRGPPRDGQVTY